MALEADEGFQISLRVLVSCHIKQNNEYQLEGFVNINRNGICNTPGLEPIHGIQ